MIDQVILSSGYIDETSSYVPVRKKDHFSTDDSVITAWVRCYHLSRKHTLRWEWIDPEGMVYVDSGKYEICQSVDTSDTFFIAWHQLLIRNEKAAQLPGRWRVAVYLDDLRLSLTDFYLAVAPDSFSSPVSFRKTILSPGEKISGPCLSLNGIPVQGDMANTETKLAREMPKSSMSRPDAVGVIIGNQDYRHEDIPDVIYAGHDARAVKETMIQTLGLTPGNILYYENLTKAGFEAVFGNTENHRGRLNNHVKPGISEVLIYYSGHGAPDPNTRRSFFLPTDCEPDAISLNGYPLNLFYRNLSKTKAKQLLVIIDACFSGGSSPGKMLVPSASPAFLKSVNATPAAETDIIIMASSKADQISSWYDEKNHGLFTYFFLQAVRGKAVLDQDFTISLKEIYAYVSDKAEGVPYWAGRLFNGRIQEPVLEGKNLDMILVSFD